MDKKVIMTMETQDKDEAARWLPAVEVLKCEYRFEKCVDESLIFRNTLRTRWVLTIFGKPEEDTPEEDTTEQ